ncbi:MAG: 3-isopropylmalate dehydratase small subunit [Cyanobacteria bacterium P01_A01_bin.135]
MTKIQTITGPALPLRGNDIDTDRIIPARFLKCVTFEGLGEHAFEDDRRQLQGDHPFDLPHHRSARILVVNRNFGCGSSREHAPQALARWGIQALIGESFAEIFFGNCVAMGVPCLVAETEAVQQLQAAVEANPNLAVTLDLETMKAHYGSHTIPLTMSEGPRQMFLGGTWDATGQLIAQAEQIKVTATQLPYVSWT